MTAFLDKVKQNRTFIDKNLNITNWDSIKHYFELLLNEAIGSVSELEEWLIKKSELDAVLEEEMAWRYINMNCDTANEKFAKSFNDFATNIQPEIIKHDNLLDKKFISCHFISELDQNKYKVVIREIKKNIEIFREENIPIFSELQIKSQEFGKINSEMLIKYKGKEYTLQQAANFTKDIKRNVREETYKLINERRLKDSKDLNKLFDVLLEKRNQIAKNADYKNFRDYKFSSLGRFDYTIEDCLEFHSSIKDEICPFVDEIMESRKSMLELDKLRPWDLSVDKNLLPALKPFQNSDELINKTIECFSKVDPKFGTFIKTMKENKYLDLDSRKGKAPGGFNYPLYESNIPFIFMNATGNTRDMVTMMHEGGHAVHSFLSKDLELVNFKSLPSEVAELASMSMELISMEYWDVFFKNKKDLIRAKREHLEDILTILPWIAIVDKFQHWIYTNPSHSLREREENWKKIYSEFSSSVVDWSGLELYFLNTWKKQLHIFEVPFYYIEYGISQLGAIAIWRNYKQNPEKAIQNYTDALSLGYSVTIPEIYQTAGIEFSFKKEYIRELIDFARQELALLKE